MMKKNFTRYLLFVTSALLLVACTSAQAPNVSSTIEYRSTKFNFRLSYPAQWMLLEDPPPMVGDNPTTLHAVTLQPPQETQSLVVVYIQTLTTTQTLDDYAARQMISLRQNELGATFSDLAPTQLAGQAARITSAADDKSQVRKMIMTINNSTAYALLWFGPDNADLSTKFDALLNSFQFLP